jgi:hypothetical protein
MPGFYKAGGYEFCLNTITRSQDHQGAFENQLIFKALVIFGIPPISLFILLFDSVVMFCHPRLTSPKVRPAGWGGTPLQPRAPSRALDYDYDPALPMI